MSQKLQIADWHRVNFAKNLLKVNFLQNLQLPILAVALQFLQKFYKNFCKIFTKIFANFLQNLQGNWQKLQLQILQKLQNFAIFTKF